MNKIIDKASFDVEDFEEEIVLVNFHTGVYYTIKGSGPEVLRAFTDGLNQEIFLETLKGNLDDERFQEVELFIAKLTEEGILIETDIDVQTGPLIIDVQHAPVFEKFDDISDLVKLDPIHDVSDLGWPHKK